jgi:hypothetical protein
MGLINKSARIVGTFLCIIVFQCGVSLLAPVHIVSPYWSSRLVQQLSINGPGFVLIFLGICGIIAIWVFAKGSK